MKNKKKKKKQKKIRINHTRTHNQLRNIEQVQENYRLSNKTKKKIRKKNSVLFTEFLLKHSEQIQNVTLWPFEWHNQVLVGI